MESTMDLGDRVARCVLKTFDELPAKRKPRLRGVGQQEWVPLSGIVIARDLDVLECVALATGMKCLPRSKIHQARGMVLHDCHAEILAIRAFNRYLLDECSKYLERPLNTSCIQPTLEASSSTTRRARFRLKPGIKLYMYCSEAPCGDASMELVMKEQTDPTPWETRSQQESFDGDIAPSADMLGRGYFSLLGMVRRKPARPDAPLSFSKSCSDKLARSQAIGLLGSATSILIDQRDVYLDALVLPASQFVPEAVQRAFGISGRLKPFAEASLNLHCKHNVPFKPFKVVTTTQEFAHSRRPTNGHDALIPSNLATVWTPDFQETLISGVLQGRKQFDARGASKICRKSLWMALQSVAIQLSDKELQGEVLVESYASLKASALLRRRQASKRLILDLALTGWQKNDGDSDFALND